MKYTRQSHAHTRVLYSMYIVVVIPHPTHSYRLSTATHVYTYNVTGLTRRLQDRE